MRDIQDHSLHDHCKAAKCSKRIEKPTHFAIMQFVGQNYRVLKGFACGREILHMCTDVSCGYIDIILLFL